MVPYVLKVIRISQEIPNIIQLLMLMIGLSPNILHLVVMLNKKRMKSGLDSMENDLANLKNEMNEIKSLLKELVNGK